MIQTLAIVFLNISTVAFAAPQKEEKKPKIVFVENYCRPGEEILNATKEGCLNNRPFVDEAEACLEKLEAEANRISSQMAKGFNKNDVSLQAAKFDASKQDYQYTVQTFDDLIKLTNQVMDEVDSYADYVNLPEDTYNNEVNGGDPEHYAEMHPCYSETRDSIDSVLDDLEDMKKDFQKGRDAAAKAAGISSDRKSNLKQDKNGSVAKPVAATKASGSSKAAAKQKPKSGASTVTGIVEDQKKRQQKK